MNIILGILSISGILWCCVGTFIGIVFGCLPGLTATMGVALFLPFTFEMDFYTSMALLLGIYCGGTYGGSISAILIRTPGTPSSAATVLDGYPLNEQGRAAEALSMAIIASFIGGIFSCGMLIFISPQLAKIALKFGPAEYFAVGIFAISMVSSLSGDNVLKGFLSALLGFFTCFVGIDGFTGTIRYTGGIPSLAAGIAIVPSLIGLFAISEVLNKLESLASEHQIGEIKRVTGQGVSLKTLKGNTLNFLRSSIIGTIVGIIPACGSAIASWMSYNEAKRATKHPELFGKGAIEGVAASEAGNNAVTGGALIPLLTLGVPGDVVTAVLLGAFMIQGLTPGPRLFSERPDIVYSIYSYLILANIAMFLIGYFGVNIFVKVLKVPMRILMPSVLFLCIVGAYAINRNMYDVKVALVMGIIGYLFSKADIPTPPMLLGVILGEIIEINFRRSLTISQGNLLVFVKRPLSLAFLLLAVVSFFWPMLSQYLRNWQKSKANAA